MENVKRMMDNNTNKRNSISSSSRSSSSFVGSGDHRTSMFNKNHNSNNTYSTGTGYGYELDKRRSSSSSTLVTTIGNSNHLSSSTTTTDQVQINQQSNVVQSSSLQAQAQAQQETNNDVYDMNGAHFNADMFIQKITREYSIDHLMKTERSLILQVQHLDSDMQTLVYENYNKFILATDTIRKMKNDFKEMEDKMALLSSNIVKITENSAKVSESLKDKRDKVARLSGIHELLKKLKFLFELPNKLKQLYEDGNYEEGVRSYLNGVKFVSEFKRFPSLEAIKQDCQHIVSKIRNDLYADFNDEEKSSQDLTRNVTLLLNLGENSYKLGNKFLANAYPKLTQNLDSLKTASSPKVSLEEFMELGCGIFLSNLSLVIASYSQVFVKTADLHEQLRLQCQEMIKPFVQDLMDKFLHLMETRLRCEIQETNHHEPERREELLKAMDRLYRRLMAMGTLMPNTDFTQSGLDLVTALAKLDSEICLNKVKKSFERAVGDSGSELKTHPASAQEILGSILSTFVLDLKSSVSRLQDYCRSEFHFAQNVEFRQRVGISIGREGLIIASFKYLIKFGKQLTKGGKYHRLVWLLISKLYLDIEAGPVQYMVNIVESAFDIRRRNPKWEVTNVESITTALNSTAKKLARAFVSFQGNKLAMLMKSAILDKDLVAWNQEATSPQIEMKRFIDILTKLEKNVEPIYPDPDSSSFLRSERSSDSSKRSYSSGLPGGGGSKRNIPWATGDRSMASNITKLFSEKVEIFGEVELNKTAILMAVVKIGVRALLEYVRLKTIGTKGLHQIQVDVHYLQLYLWRFMNEGFLYTLLDEIITSAVQRCVNPILLEATVVQILAEKGH